MYLTAYRLGIGIPCNPVSIIYLSILQQIHYIPLYAVSNCCIQLYPYVSSGI